MANFVVSGTPHVRSKESIQSIMRDVIIALVPATAAGIYYFGLRALILIVAAIISAVFFEWLYEKITKKPVTINDLSAVVTGLLLAMNLPASAPVWVAIVGSAFAIIFAKQLFGGLGQNFINPALAGRAFLLASYPTEMTTWVVPNGLAADAATYATPLAQLKNGALDASLKQLVIGQVGGTNLCNRSDYRRYLPAVQTCNQLEDSRNLHRNRIHSVRSNRQTRHAYAFAGNLRRRRYAGWYLHGN